MRSISRAWRLAIALFLVLPVLPLSVPARAAKFFSDAESAIPLGVTIDDDVYVLNGTVVIDGRIIRSLVVAGGTVTLNGRVDGDVIAAGGTVTLQGPVGGTVRVAAGTVTINGPVGWDVLIGGGDLTTGPDSRIAHDLLLGVRSATIDGQIGGNIRGTATRVQLLGSVRGDVMLDVAESLSLGPQAVVDGDLIYSSPQEASISPGARVLGETRFTLRAPQARAEPALLERVTAWFETLFLRLAWAVVAGSLLVLLLPRHIAGVADTLREAPLPSLLWGLALLIAVPILVVIGLVTVVGIPAALLLLGLYLAVLYLSQVILGISLVRGIAPRAWRSDRRLVLWLTMLIGTSLVVLVRLLPLPLGIASWWTVIVSLLVGATALGALWTTIIGWGKARPVLAAAVATVPPPTESGSPRPDVVEPPPGPSRGGLTTPDTGPRQPSSESVFRSQTAPQEQTTTHGTVPARSVPAEEPHGGAPGVIEPDDQSRADRASGQAAVQGESEQQGESKQR